MKKEQEVDENGSDEPVKIDHKKEAGELKWRPDILKRPMGPLTPSNTLKRPKVTIKKAPGTIEAVKEKTSKKKEVLKEAKKKAEEKEMKSTEEKSSVEGEKVTSKEVKEEIKKEGKEAASESEAGTALKTKIEQEEKIEAAAQDEFMSVIELLKELNVEHDAANAKLDEALSKREEATTKESTAKTIITETEVKIQKASTK